jgi:DNA-binding PadR family transcriptional regulator
MNRVRPDSNRMAVIEALLDGISTAPEIIERTGASMATVYACLRSMTNNGWLKKTAVVGAGRRRYELTPAGVRALRFTIELAQSSVDDSRSSNPTAARNSS